jgi:hypothetical protein
MEHETGFIVITQCNTKMKPEKRKPFIFDCMGEENFGI